MGEAAMSVPSGTIKGRLSPVVTLAAPEPALIPLSPLMAPMKDEPQLLTGGPNPNRLK